VPCTPAGFSFVIFRKKKKNFSLMRTTYPAHLIRLSFDGAMLFDEDDNGVKLLLRITTPRDAGVADRSLEAEDRTELLRNLHD
jgi:hypothetical protein